MNLAKSFDFNGFSFITSKHLRRLRITVRTSVVQLRKKCRELNCFIFLTAKIFSFFLIIFNQIHDSRSVSYLALRIYILC